MNLSRSAAKLFTAEAAGAVLSFLGIVAFTRELTSTQLGTFFLFQAILTFVSIPADLGIRGAVEKRVSEGTDRADYLSSAVVLKTGLTAVFVVLIFAFRGYINAYIGSDVAVLLGVGVFVQELALLMLVVLRGELRVGETAVLVLVRRVVWVGLGIVLVEAGFGLKGPIYSLITGFIVMAALGWWKVSTPIGSPTREQAVSLIAYSRYNFVSSLGGFSYAWIDVLFIGYFLSQPAVAAYEVAWRITSLFMLFTRSVASSIFPQVSQWSKSNQTANVESILPNALITSLIIVLPALAGSIVLAHEILGLVFAPEYVAASLVLVVLMTEQSIQVFHVIFGRTLQAMNRPGLAAKPAVVTIAVNLLLNTILINWMGILGAAFATTIAFGLNTVMQGFYLNRLVSLKLPWREIQLICLVSAIMALAVWGIKSSMVIDSALELATIVVVGALIYTGLVLSLPALRNQVVAGIRSFVHS